MSASADSAEDDRDAAGSTNDSGEKGRARARLIVPLTGTAAVLALLLLPSGRGVLFRSIYAIGPVLTRQRVLLSAAEDGSGGHALLSLALAEDASPEVRVTAARGLSRLGLESARDSLTRALTDSDPRVRAHAAHGLGALEPRPETVELLVGRLFVDVDVNVRTAMLSALIRLHRQQTPTERTRERIKRLTTDPEATVARLARKFLESSAPDGAGTGGS